MPKVEVCNICGRPPRAIWTGSDKQNGLKLYHCTCNELSWSRGSWNKLQRRAMHNRKIMLRLKFKSIFDVSNEKIEELVTLTIKKEQASCRS